MISRGDFMISFEKTKTFYKIYKPKKNGFLEGMYENSEKTRFFMTWRFPPTPPILLEIKIVIENVQKVWLWI